MYCGRLPVCFPVDKAGLRALFAMLLFLPAALTNGAFFVSQLLFLLRSVDMISGSRVCSGRICEKQYYCDWPLTSVRVILTFDLSGVVTVGTEVYRLSMVQYFPALHGA